IKPSTNSKPVAIDTVVTHKAIMDVPAGCLTGHPNATLETLALSNTSVKTAETHIQQEHAAGIKGNKELEMMIKRHMQEENRESKKRRKTEANKSIVVNSAPKLSKSILTMRKPFCKSALNTISAVPPPLHLFTMQEQQLLKNLNKNIFKIITSINIKMLERFTRDHTNRPFIDY